MKNILVPCDFSKPAINAFRFALDVAAHSRGTIFLAHIIEIPVVHDPLITPVSTLDPNALTDWKLKVENKLKNLIEKYRSNIKVIPCVEFGAPASAIKNLCESVAADIVIMGSHGATGLKEVFIGSNAQKVVRHADIPVLVIKDYRTGPITDIVFPNTLETEDQQELTMKVKALQAFFKATVHILFVNTPTNFTSDTITLNRLKEFAKHFMFKDYTLNVCSDRYEEDGIMNFTKSLGGDLIAMGTNARKGIPHMIKGSVTENIVNHASTPIWTYALN